MELKRSVKCQTVLGEKLLFRKMTGEEFISGAYRYHVEFLSDVGDVTFEDMLGTSVTVAFIHGLDTPRYFHGYISRFAYIGSEKSDSDNLIYHVYEAVLRPWLWFLNRKSDCRIFQELTVEDIVNDVISIYPNANIEWQLHESHETRTYCVQYRESDFNFVSRLLEDEGIFYYFKHEDGDHVMVVSDSANGYEEIGDYAEIPYYPLADRARRKRDHIHAWKSEALVQPGTVVLQSYDFENPSADLEVRRQQPEPHEQAEGERYDYPGLYTQLGHGDQIASRRLEEELAEWHRASGEATACGLSPGRTFTLTEYPRSSENIRYLCVSIAHELWSNAYEAKAPGDEEERELYTAKFEVQPADRVYRPARNTAKPIVKGPQTATVTGDPGAEIWTDEYGRVKVQFHWDRLNPDDQTSSCWIRVSQVWAGSGYGAIHIPRIGQEVIVGFLEGDPDRPIITGRVYNAEQMPPYPLPGDMNKSGIKSNSTKGGGGYNEIMLDDTKGSELFRMHAQKNETIIVLNDKDETVHHDETINIMNDRTEKVGHDETMTVINNRTRNVGVNETVSVGSNRSDSVGGSENRSVAIAQQQSVGAARNVSVGAAQSHEIGAVDAWAVGLNQTINIGRNQDLDVGNNRSTSIGDNESLDVGKDMKVDVGKNLIVKAGDQITIVTGKASIVMKKDGSITIKGKDIKMEGSGKINAKASGTISMKGSKILQN